MSLSSATRLSIRSSTSCLRLGSAVLTHAARPTASNGSNASAGTVSTSGDLSDARTSWHRRHAVVGTASTSRSSSADPGHRRGSRAYSRRSGANPSARPCPDFSTSSSPPTNRSLNSSRSGSGPPSSTSANAGPSNTSRASAAVVTFGCLTRLAASASASARNLRSPSPSPTAAASIAGLTRPDARVGVLTGSLANAFGLLGWA